MCGHAGRGILGLARRRILWLFSVACDSVVHLEVTVRVFLFG